MEGAFKLAERIRQIVHNAKWKHRPITVSIGISGLESGTQEAATIVERADKALYHSKTSGRDKVTSFAA